MPARGNLSVDPVKGGVQEVDVGELLGNQKTVMGVELAGQRLFQLGKLVPQPPMRQLCQHSRIGLSRHQGHQDVVSGFAEDSCGHRGQLDLGAFQHLLQPIDLLGALLDQGRAIAREFAQLALGTVWDEAGPQEPMAQEVSDPLGVLDSGLASGHGLAVLGLDDK
jgi:hypothetical protein